jgi:hypothetical protein
MSQSALRAPRKDEVIYVELQGDGRSAWATGRSERAAADAAETRWHSLFGRVRPTRKTVVVRRIS